jgi:hypothetical protein
MNKFMNGLIWVVAVIGIIWFCVSVFRFLF